MDRWLRIGVCGGWVLALGLAAGAQCSHLRDADAAENPAWAEFAASMKKMHSAVASLKSSGSSDADFVALMLPHHRAAIDMARTELVYGKDPQMRRLAQEIITDQESEVALMELWAKQHGAKAESSSVVGGP